MSADRVVYADSSALVKLVITEPETRALKGFLSPWPTLLTSRLTMVEVMRATRIANPAPEVARAAEAVLGSCILVDVDDAVLRSASRLASKAVRSLDAIHLATALTIGADELLAYDQRLLAAAAERGLAASHPGGERG